MYNLAIFIANFFIIANLFLGLGMPCRCTDMFHKKKGLMQVLVGLAPSSQTAGSLLRTPLARKVIWTIDLSIAPITNLSISAITNFYIFAKVFYFFV